VRILQGANDCSSLVQLVSMDSLQQSHRLKPEQESPSVESEKEFTPRYAVEAYTAEMQGEVSKCNSIRDSEVNYGPPAFGDDDDDREDLTTES